MLEVQSNAPKPNPKNLLSLARYFKLLLLNILNGVIQDIKTHGNLTLVKVIVEDIIFTSIIIETPSTVSYLKPKAEVKVMFKETEVIISKNPVEISMQNQIPVKVLEVKKGQLLSQLTLQFHQNVFRSLITSNAVEQLGISAGQDVIAMIKTNEIMLSE
jgi:molybdopterin-binding protein